MQATIYNEKGAESGKVNLPESVFGVAWNPSLVSQVILALQANLRRGTAHAKDRSEVRGGGRKPWRQKGTGRARHGSIRSPIWRSGGVTFGPRNDKDYSQKINKKMRKAALASVLSKKFEEGEILFVESLSMKEPKTSAGLGVLRALSKIKGAENILSKKRNSALVALFEKDSNIEKSFRNFSNISVVEARNISANDAMKHKLVVFVGGQDLLNDLEEKFSKSKIKVSDKDPKTEKKASKAKKSEPKEKKKSVTKKKSGAKTKVSSKSKTAKSK